MSARRAIIALATAAAACIIGYQTDAAMQQPMPPGFEALRWGMSAQELRAARPNVKKDDFYASEMRVETLPERSTFSTALYDFGSNGLWRLTLSRDLKSEQVPGSCSRALRELITFAGDRYTLGAGVVSRRVSKDAPDSFPVVRWNTPTAWVELRCVRSQSSAALAPNNIEAVVADRKVPAEQAIRVKLQEDASPETIQRLFTPILPEALRK